MAFLFGGGKPPKPPPDPVREQRLELQRAARAMDREDLKAARTEALLKREIEAQARLQRYDACQAKARELIRLRAHRSRLSHNPRGVHRMLQEFERHSTALSVGQEVVEETLDSVFEVEGEGDAADDAMVAVFAELGLDQRVIARPRVEPCIDAELETRLARLRDA
jgi:hypothetical protein